VLETLGLKILRFKNDEILNQTEQVLNLITKHLVK